jgi:cytochrome c biogenesis protein CcmG/thiol:disulfide interchange protein DsbE
LSPDTAPNAQTGARTGRATGGRGRRLLFLLPVAGFLALVGLFVDRLGHDPAALPSALIDKPAPAFALAPAVADRPGLARADLGGRPVLVNFFASWCAPCRLEHATLAGLAASGVPLYGIAYKDKPENAAHFLGELGDPYQRLGLDLDGRTAIEFGVYGVPETFLVDRAGRIRFRHAGALTDEVLQREILPRLAALERP